ncbi:putative Ig domain-containing protein [Rhodococcus sp. NPDC056743]|uniref:putative Ig domain-containing protein n=1 Tax=Rhodococcus sp. NPDC056743 TaxID=3345934 RepID=UPI00366B9A5D
MPTNDLSTGLGTFTVTKASSFADRTQLAMLAVAGTPFIYTINVTGTPAPSVGVTAGVLPAGLTFTGEVLSGTPTAAGIFTLTLTANGAGTPATFTVTVTVASAADAPELPATGSLGSISLRQLTFRPVPTH